MRYRGFVYGITAFLAFITMVTVCDQVRFTAEDIMASVAVFLIAIFIFVCLAIYGYILGQIRVRRR